MPTPHGHIFWKNAAIPGFSEIAAWKKKLLFYLRRYAYKKCDTIVALSEVDLKEQVALRLASANKFVTIMNGIDIKYYAEKVPSVVNINGRIIGSIGRLSREKGHDILIEAFAKVSERIPEAKLLIVGDGLEKKKLGLNSRRMGATTCGAFFNGRKKISCFFNCTRKASCYQ